MKTSIFQDKTMNKSDWFVASILNELYMYPKASNPSLGIFSPFYTLCAIGIKSRAAIVKQEMCKQLPYAW